jgi:hypothetical protein
MSVVHAALMGSYRTSNGESLPSIWYRVSNCTTHVSWTKHTACQWNGQAHVLSIMNTRVRVAQRRHVRFCPLAYAARSMPRGSIGSPPERGAGVYADRSGSYQTRSGHVSALDPRLSPN